MKRYRGNLLLILALLVVGLVTGRNALSNKQEDLIPFKDLRIFSQILGRVKDNYVEDVTDTTLFENAMRGMLSGLDPHSSYLDTEEYRELKENTSGKFGGLGIEVTLEDGFIKVITPIDDTPAQRAGVQPGDLIIRLDDKPVKNMSLNEAVGLMRGKPGTAIELMIMREGVEQPFILSLERDVVRTKSVRSRLLEPEYAYIRISNFQDKTGDDLVAAIDQLKQKSTPALKGLVLDLRNNPGGVLSAAVEMADAFLDEGLIVYTKVRGGHIGQEFRADAPDPLQDSGQRRLVIHGDLLNGVPLVVLVNEGSASASEIVAGAIQDHARGIIMGEQTFGKGSVQTVLPLENGSAVKITTARYYTPKGRSIQAEGIKPDIRLKNFKLANGDDRLAIDPIKEANLSRHLAKPGAPASPPPVKDLKKPADKQQAADEELLARDYELFEALNLLKALNVLGKRG
jgi:carboxyl-terminal processing protease